MKNIRKLSGSQKRMVSEAAKSLALELTNQFIKELDRTEATISLFSWGDALVYLDGNSRLVASRNWPRELLEKLIEESKDGSFQEYATQCVSTLKCLKECVRLIEDGIKKSK